MVCEYMREKALTVNILWDIAYGLHHEALCLDSLEDFNATEADLMSMKDNILAKWKSRDARKTLSLGPTFVSSADSKGQGSTLGRTFISGGATASSGALCGPGGGTGEVSSSFFRPLAPPPRIPSMSGLSPYIQGLLPTSFPTMGMPVEYNFDPITGATPESINPRYILPVFPTMGCFVPNLHQPTHHRSVEPARAEPGGMSTSGWVPVSLIPSGSGQKNTHCDCVLFCCQDNPVFIA